VLSSDAKAELAALPNQKAGERVFANRAGQPYTWRKLWCRVTEHAGFTGYNFHLLRHSCGSTLASEGVGQAAIMEAMGHKTLHASRRYLHLNVAARKEIVHRVFG